MDNLNPQFPIYILSKGRWESRLTSKSLEEMKVPYFIVIEEQEYPQYSAVIDPKKIIILDKKYQESYDACMPLNPGQSKGSGPARNFIWDHSINSGFSHHWIMDDNIDRFYRLYKNTKIIASTGAIFKAMEDFTLRYDNVAISGPQYFMFAPRKSKLPPFVINTRLYSCMLIKNSIPFRWRCRYNEDTDLSLRILKSGLATIQFNAFLQKKTTTQVMKGGNTDAFYAEEGTMPKSSMLYKLHPDVTKIVFKFNRWHHYVDYSKFKNNNLMKKDIPYSDQKNEYGMKLIKVSN